MVFDNQRTLHGRKGYQLAEGAHRHLQGGYVDWDEMKSKSNLIKSQLGRMG